MIQYFYGGEIQRVNITFFNGERELDKVMKTVHNCCKRLFFVLLLYIFISSSCPKDNLYTIFQDGQDKFSHTELYLCRGVLLLSKRFSVLGY